MKAHQTLWTVARSLDGTNKSSELYKSQEEAVKAREARGGIVIAPHNTLGGWIEKEENLSHLGNCWVYGKARVYGEAQVSGEARVSGKAWVYGECTIDPIVLTGFPHTVIITDKEIRAGCQLHNKEVWKERCVAIIKADGHTTEQAKSWANIINGCAEAHTAMLNS